QALHEAGIDITDRMVGSGHIGHNKFVVLTDSKHAPKAVWTGSTNWTDTGICAQSNNGILVESPALAKIYLDYWNRMKADDSEQGQTYRATNNSAHAVQADKGNTDITLWFSPNTKQKTKPSNAAQPGDMGDAFDAIKGAKEAVLFLVFQPGTPSVVE